MPKKKTASVVGTWHIYEMELWDEEYFNMEVKAYITINQRGRGDFQFGLVSGGLTGAFSRYGDTDRFDFTWEGNDECDEALGSGWLTLKSSDEVAGSIGLLGGDRSAFAARRA